MNRLVLLTVFAAICSLYGANGQVQVERVDPPNWFSDMKLKYPDLLVYGKGIGKSTQVSGKGDAFVVLGFRALDHEDYLQVNIRADKPGKGELVFQHPSGTTSIPYEIVPKSNRTTEGILPVNQSDLVYLVMPDRFANGAEANDVVEGMAETCTRRDSSKCRHGGDLKGLASGLDYVSDLGFTAMWLNPVQENNQPDESYHGYAITDHYRIDPRLGTNQDYFELCKTARKKGIKMVMDVVLNHCGNNHYLFKNPPSRGMFHQWDEFTRTNYRATTQMDPYASQYDKKRMNDGWFDKHMPDFDHTNRTISTYLIQNTIWWIEMAGLNALRVDTWAYSDFTFTDQWLLTIKADYPDLFVFGEVWEHGYAIQSFYTSASPVNRITKSNLPGITDFQWYYAINEIVSGKFGWTDGLSRMYYTLVHDFVYGPTTLPVTFLDNHDLTRIMHMANGNADKLKLALALLYTMRGLPVVLYGTELGMNAAANPDARVRLDMPGGWSGDMRSVFSKQNLSEKELDLISYVKNLGMLRKKYKALSSGKLTHFVPEDNIYVYFREFEGEKIMIVVNNAAEIKQLPLARFGEKTANTKMATELITDEALNWTSQLSLKPNSVGIYLLK